MNILLEVSINHISNSFCLLLTFTTFVCSRGAFVYIYLLFVFSICLPWLSICILYLVFVSLPILFVFTFLCHDASYTSISYFACICSLCLLGCWTNRPTSSLVLLYLYLFLLLSVFLEPICIQYSCFSIFLYFVFYSVLHSLSDQLLNQSANQLAGFIAQQFVLNQKPNNGLLGGFQWFSMI